jgi:prepilin-type N-terminal cleavage/methylation domain-containing protein
MTRVLRRGFTLIELLVAMTIGIVLLLMAMPRMILWMSDPPNTVLQTVPFIEGSKDATFNAVDVSNSAATTVTFNPLGQVIANAINIAKVDVTMPAISATRPLCVIVGNHSAATTFYGVKLGDPAFPATEPNGCP